MESNIFHSTMIFMHSLKTKLKILKRVIRDEHSGQQKYSLFLIQFYKLITNILNNLL